MRVYTMGTFKDLYDIANEGVKTAPGRWAFALTVGGAIGGVLSAIMGNTLGGTANWAVFGLAIGVSQLLILPELRKEWFSWILFSGIAWAVMGRFPAGSFMAPAATGLMLGILQGYIIHKHRKRAYLWIPANIIAWVVGGAVGLVVAIQLTSAGLVGFDMIAGLASASLIGALILWVALANMPVNQSKDSASMNKHDTQPVA
jgi:hypothetical protein